MSLAGEVGMSQRSLAISISSRSLTGNQNGVRNDDVKLATIPGVLWFAKARSTRLYMILAFICAICSGAVVPGESESFAFKWMSLQNWDVSKTSEVNTLNLRCASSLQSGSLSLTQSLIFHFHRKEWHFISAELIRD